MHSALAVTTETYDMDLAASELAAQIKASFPPVANSCGILFADPDYDGELLLARLRDELDMEIIGSTSAAMLSSRGYHAMCATLLVMGGDDCVFGAALSPPLDGIHTEQQLKETFDRARAKLGNNEPVVIFTLSAADAGCIEDARLSLLRKFGGDIPVFGGVAADHFEFAHTRVFGEGGSGTASMALLLAGGNIRPKFVMRNVSRKHLSKSRITSSSGNTVHTIDGVSAYDYMVRHGADASSSMALHFTPLLVETQDGENDDGHIICRPFIALDPETGHGTTISEVPVGSAVTVQTIQGSDIGDASRDAMESLLRGIEEEKDYHYSTVLVMSCAARHMVLAFDREREAILAKSIFPAGLNFAGFYSFGEFCPISVEQGKADNRLHNLSLGLCAL